MTHWLISYQSDYPHMKDFLHGKYTDVLTAWMCGDDGRSIRRYVYEQHPDIWEEFTAHMVLKRLKGEIQ